MQRLEAANPAEHWAGLSEREASERRRTDGPNELPADRKRGWLRILADVLREPMLGLLVLCGAIYVILGDRGEAAMLSAFVAVIIAISVLQAQKAERTLDELRRLSAAQAIVIRSGRQQRIQARNVVRGDLVVLIEGDRVPADVVLISGRNVSVDESLLTGESAPVRKSIVIAVPDVMGKPGGNDLPFVYSGTMIVQGKGLGRVLAIGKETEIGRIGRALTGIVPEPARAQVETTRIVRCLAIAAALLSLTVTLIYGYQRGSWLQAALVGIAFAMAIMPEELPVVLSAFFGLGSWRIARNGVLTRYLPAIETLGATTVLCVDKTGTITANQMRVAALSSPDGATWFSGVEPLPDAFHEILEFGVLASHRDPFDPTERAIAQALDSFLADTEHVHRDWVLGGEYPLSREMLAMSRAWSSAAGGSLRPRVLRRRFRIFATSPQIRERRWRLPSTPSRREGCACSAWRARLTAVQHFRHRSTSSTSNLSASLPSRTRSVVEFLMRLGKPTRRASERSSSPATTRRPLLAWRARSGLQTQNAILPARSSKT